MDTVVAYRKRFLQMYNRDESNDKFKQFAKDFEVDWETVKTKIRADKEREAAASQ